MGSNRNHLACINPRVSVTVDALHWQEIVNALDHYYKLLEAFDPGGTHREGRARIIEFEELVDTEIRSSLRRSAQATSSPDAEWRN